MKRQNLSTVHQIMIGFGVAAVFVLAVEAFQSGHPGWRIESQNEDGSYSISMRDGRDRLKVKSRGKVEFEDDRRVERLEVGARFKVEERLDGIEHRLVVTPKADGSPDYSYRVDGQARDFDTEAETWLAGVLLRVFRSTGVDAERRVRSLFDQSGVEGVLEEVSFISSDSVIASYLGHLLALATESSDLTSDDLSNILKKARQQVDSDYHLAQLLESVPAGRLEEPQVLESFVAAARALESDYHLRQLLGSVLDRLYADPQPSPSTLDSLLAAAREIESDHEVMQLLSQVAELHPADLDLPSNLVPLLRSIESDYSLHRALGGFLTPETSSENRRILFSIAKNIESDHELSELLVEVASRSRPGQTFGKELFELLGVLESDHALGRAAEALGGILVPSQIPELLGAVQIESDFQARSLLVALLEAHGASVAKDPSFLRFQASIESDFERQQVQNALADATSRAPVGRPVEETVEPGESEAPSDVGQPEPEAEAPMAEEPEASIVEEPEADASETPTA